MNKKNQILIAEVIQKVMEGFEGEVNHHLYGDNPKGFAETFFGKKTSGNRTVLEFILEEATPGETKKTNGRPAGSVKTI